MGLFDGIFGTPNQDKASAEQANLVFNQLSLGNQLHNKGTSGKILQELSIRNYGKQISNQRRKVVHAQGTVFKTAESIAKLRATRGSVNEGGRSSRFAKNQTLMLLSQLDKAENLLRYSKGEQAAVQTNIALAKYQSDFARANEMIGIGVGAKRGITYTTDNNALKFAKLAINVGSGNLGGLIPETEGSLFKYLGTRIGMIS
tara:strand:- start:94 stop:699 length:606 start_codon:yes stop_codon:yes gene_type:complete